MAVPINQNDLTALREEFKRLREVRNISQETVSELLGVTQPAISQFENGTKTNQQPRPSTLNKINHLLEIWRASIEEPEDNIVELQNESTEGLVRCLKCEKLTDSPDREPDNQHCKKCGARLPIECPNCHHRNVGDSKHCNQCAWKLDDSAGEVHAKARGQSGDELRSKLIGAFVQYLDDTNVIEQLRAR